MPRLTFTQSVAGGATYNPMTGTNYETLPWPAAVKLLAVAAATGVVATVFAGSEAIQEEGPVDARTAVTASQLPNSYITEPLGFLAAAGDKLRIAIRNTTGGAVVVTGIIDMEPS